MSADRIDQETAERLLGGLAAMPSAAAHPVVLLLTAVRAAARPGELAGLGHAVQGFRRAQAQHRRPPPARRLGRSPVVERSTDGTTAADLRTGEGTSEV
ncbi:hypothetical protein [Micromonospora sp. NPDC005172]|uniref:hypothetical protein n=1 Tax=Micromonospora sp. NPDC005172 TaxID=3156867 RepID=UPI0033AD9E29